MEKYDDRRQIVDKATRLLKEAIDGYIKAGDEEVLDKLYLNIIETIKTNALEDLEIYDRPIKNIISKKLLSLYKIYKNREEAIFIGEHAPKMLDDLIDNYKRVLIGVNITSDNTTYDNIMTLIDQKVEVDSYSYNFLIYKESAFFERNRNYVLTNVYFT